jgi:hypothetical protein
MPKFSEDVLISFTEPPSDHEESKFARSEKLVKEAIAEDATLSQMSTYTFGQGSYANDTNVRLNSDIDINVCLTEVFYFGLPDGKQREDFGLNNPSNYEFSTYKNSVEAALVKKFGRSDVVRNDKCLTVKESSDRVETDVVPTFEYRRYSESRSYVQGVRFESDKGKIIDNFPIQHIENGKGKNRRTLKRFKRLTRIYRRIRYTMIDDGTPVSDSITSFLLECLVWNVPDNIFNNNYSWTDRLKSSIVYLYENTKSQELCKEWGEVSELLYLFHPGRKWTSADVNAYLVTMWNYLEY